MTAGDVTNISALTELKFLWAKTFGDPLDGNDAVIVLDYNNISNAPPIRFIRDDVKKMNDK